MCCERPPIPVVIEDHTYMYVRGGKGNQRLIGWDHTRTNDSEWIREIPKRNPINLTKQQNPNHSYMSKPMTIRRKGRVIRFKPHNKGS